MVLGARAETANYNPVHARATQFTRNVFGALLARAVRAVTTHTHSIHYHYDRAIERQNRTGRQTHTTESPSLIARHHRSGHRKNVHPSKRARTDSMCSRENGFVEKNKK